MPPKLLGQMRESNLLKKNQHIFCLQAYFKVFQNNSSSKSRGHFSGWCYGLAHVTLFRNATVGLCAHACVHVGWGVRIVEEKCCPIEACEASANLGIVN